MAIQHDARELDVQYLLGHASPDIVRRYSSSYRSEQAAIRHERFRYGAVRRVGPVSTPPISMMT